MIIAGGVVVLIVVIVLLVRLLGQDSGEIFVQTVEEQAQGAVTNCESTLDPDGCRQQAVTDIASETGLVETCELLETAQEMDNCYWIVAMGKMDSTYCDAISDEVSKNQCADGIAQDIAFESKDAGLCDKIIESKRAARCKAILNEVPAPTSQDADEDGLTDEQEVEYGTDSANPDSDGDGYLDGSEVDAGYNPLGSGRLQ